MSELSIQDRDELLKEKYLSLPEYSEEVVLVLAQKRGVNFEESIKSSAESQQINLKDLSSDEYESTKSEIMDSILQKIYEENCMALLETSVEKFLEVTIKIGSLGIENVLQLEEYRNEDGARALALFAKFSSVRGEQLFVDQHLWK